MANPTNRLILAALMLCCAAPSAVAENAYPFEPYYNWASRADGIALSAGDANRANIAIQTPTPWPEYLNDTDIEFNARSAEDLMRKYYGRNAKAAPPPSTVINLGTPAATP
jgi:hypothetical protein